MTDTPKLKATDLMSLTWKQLIEMPAFVLGVQEVLNPGPWEHGAENIGGNCVRCGKHLQALYSLPERHRPCPVPPPIADPPEVVARKLRDATNNDTFVPSLFVNAVNLITGEAVCHLETAM